MGCGEVEEVQAIDRLLLASKVIVFANELSSGGGTWKKKHPTDQLLEQLLFRFSSVTASCRPPKLLPDSS